MRIKRKVIQVVASDLLEARRYMALLAGIALLAAGCDEVLVVSVTNLSSEPVVIHEEFL